MVVRPVTGLSLCAGVGTIDIGLDLAFQGHYRAVGYVERDAYAAATLVARMEDETLAPAPVWDDLTSFDGSPWSGRVDLISAGFPCQPFSQAGKKRGKDDTRWLWPHIARIISDVHPGLVFLENVPPLVKRGLGDVLRDLDRLGFDAEWSTLRASDVGAPHRRKRLWILAYRHGVGCELFRGGLLLGQTGPAERHDPDRSSGAHVADTEGVTGWARAGEGVGRHVNWVEPPDRGDELADSDGVGEGEPHDPARSQPWGVKGTDVGRNSSIMVNAQGQGREGQGLRGRATERGAVWPHVPKTTKPGQQQMVLNPRFVEWLMGWPLGWTDCERSATESYQQWLRLHSYLLRSVLVPAVEPVSFAEWMMEWAHSDK